MSEPVKQTAFRLRPELIRQLDAYAARRGREEGFAWTRTDALCALIKAGLEAERPEKKQKRST
jgi:predicted DNA-binding protein